MRTSILLTLATLILSVAGAFGQAGLREKDPDAYKFIGTWTYEANGECFSITFWTFDIRLGKKEDGSPNRVEALTGTWKVKNSQGEGEHSQNLAIVCGTIKNPNMLEGSMGDDDYEKRYHFTLEYTGSDEAVWKVSRVNNTGIPKAGAILVAPPTECVMKKVE